MRLALTAAATLIAGQVWAAKKQDVTSVVTLKGTCHKLTIAGQDRSALCKGKVINIDMSDGSTRFIFMTDNGQVVLFNVPGSDEVKPDPDTAVASVDKVVLAAKNDTNEVRASGSCKFHNPNDGPVPVDCKAESAFGLFEASFMTDGSAPETR